MSDADTKYSEGLIRAEAFFSQVFPSLDFKSNVEKPHLSMENLRICIVIIVKSP